MLVMSRKLVFIIKKKLKVFDIGERRKICALQSYSRVNKASLVDLAGNSTVLPERKIAVSKCYHSVSYHVTLTFYRFSTIARWIEKFWKWEPICLSLLVSRWCTEEVHLSFGTDPPSSLILVLQQLGQGHLKKKNTLL